MSLNSYGAIERGDTNLSLMRINELAMIFDISLMSLFENVNHTDGEEDTAEEVLQKRRKSDRMRRKEDLTIIDIQLLKIGHEFEKYKLQQELNNKEFEHMINAQMVTVVEKMQQFNFIEDTFIKKEDLNLDE